MTSIAWIPCVVASLAMAFVGILLVTAPHHKHKLYNESSKGNIPSLGKHKALTVGSDPRFEIKQSGSADKWLNTPLPFFQNDVVESMSYSNVKRDSAFGGKGFRVPHAASGISEEPNLTFPKIGRNRVSTRTTSLLG